MDASQSGWFTLLHRNRQQQTISGNAKIKGFGFWSGRDVQLEFRPASENTGIVFVRRDLGDHARIAASVSNRVESPRRTTLSSNGASVEMVEHVIAALAGLQIDNCEVWVDAPEMPGLDGSSQPFVDALRKSTIVKQSAIRSCVAVTEVTRVGDDDSWIEARPGEPGRFSIQYRLDFGSDNQIGRETFRSNIDNKVFENELAGARTFILKAEAEWLRQQGLAQRVTAKDVLVFDDDGVIDNELRFEDECVRHKVLDMIGDLALAGCDIHGHFVAYRSGHRLNANIVKVLLSEGRVVEDLRRSA